MGNGDKMSAFTGFGQPKENYSKLPHALIDELSNITSEAEVKVILYILRHTWGYHDSEKKITIDEFCNGRKRKDGTRIDTGCGLTPNAVKAGIAKAAEHGYIIIEEDASDLARIKRYYSINSGGQTLTPYHQTLTPRPSNFDPRTEKETTERNLEFPPNGTTAHDVTRLRAKSLKYCEDYQPKEHRLLFEAIIDAMGKRKLVDADDSRTIGDWQQVAVTLHRAGETAETIREKTPAWRNSYWGKRDATTAQFISFMGNDTTPITSNSKNDNVVQTLRFGEGKPW